jgi:hypothetical protein
LPAVDQTLGVVGCVRVVADLTEGGDVTPIPPLLGFYGEPLTECTGAHGNMYTKQTCEPLLIILVVVYTS